MRALTARSIVVFLVLMGLFWNCTQIHLQAFRTPRHTRGPSRLVARRPLVRTEVQPGDALRRRSLVHKDALVKDHAAAGTVRVEVRGPARPRRVEAVIGPLRGIWPLVPIRVAGVSRRHAAVLRTRTRTHVVDGTCEASTDRGLGGFPLLRGFRLGRPPVQHLIRNKRAVPGLASRVACSRSNAA